MRRFLLARSRFAFVARILSTLPRMKGVTAPNNLPRATLAVQYNAAVRQKVGRRVDQGRCVRFAEVHAVLTVANLYDDVASHRDGA